MKQKINEKNYGYSDRYDNDGIFIKCFLHSNIISFQQDFKFSASTQKAGKISHIISQNQQTV